MKNMLSHTLLALTLTSSLVPHALADDIRPIDRYIDVHRSLPPLPPISFCRIDPAAQSLDFVLVRRTARFRGVVRITGVVKNLGRANFLSGPRQQSVHLYQDNRIVATRAFQTLGAGATLAVAFERAWDASSPAEGEFPPQYKLVLSYDPDIAIDGNINNDDCNSRNNLLTRSGSAINALF